MQDRVLDFYENTGLDVQDYIKVLQRKPYTYGPVWLPHDGAAHKLGSKKSIQEIIKDAGFDVRIVPRQKIADGINATRLVFNQLWFDQVKCDAGLARLRRYKYKVVDGKFSPEPLHDENSDAADALRTFALARRVPKGKSNLVDKLTQGLDGLIESAGNWMGY
jgi:hypothetical protein